MISTNVSIVLGPSDSVRPVQPSASVVGAGTTRPLGVVTLDDGMTGAVSITSANPEALEDLAATLVHAAHSLRQAKARAERQRPQGDDA